MSASFCCRSRSQKDHPWDINNFWIKIIGVFIVLWKLRLLLVFATSCILTVMLIVDDWGFWIRRRKIVGSLLWPWRFSIWKVTMSVVWGWIASKALLYWISKIIWRCSKSIIVLFFNHHKVIAWGLRHYHPALIIEVVIFVFEAHVLISNLRQWDMMSNNH